MCGGAGPSPGSGAGAGGAAETAPRTARPADARAEAATDEHEIINPTSMAVETDVDLPGGAAVGRVCGPRGGVPPSGAPLESDAVTADGQLATDATSRLSASVL